jgi:renalase
LKAGASFDHCVVVGAGIAGLTAARALSEQGKKIIIVEQSDTVGGRMGSRMIGELPFNLGAQFFAAGSQPFARMVANWIEEGVVEVWGRGFQGSDASVVPDGFPRYRGVPSMSAIPEHLARGLEVRTGTEIEHITCRSGRWVLETVQGELIETEALVMTPPVPLLLEMADDAGMMIPIDAKAEMEETAFDPALVLLVTAEGPTALPVPGGVRMPVPEILFIGEQTAPGATGRAVTVYASPLFSGQHFGDDDDFVKTQLLGLAGPWLGEQVTRAAVHRWKYSQPVRCCTERCVLVEKPALAAFAGDAFGSPRVEGAVLSGLAAADALIHTIL